MAKLYFRYGAMGSSKTANALMVRHNYLEKNQKVVLLKPKIENRDGVQKIRSRIGLEADCEFVEDYLSKENLIQLYQGTLEAPMAIIVDEAQFLSVEEVNCLAELVDILNITVFCYGLRTDFQGNLFEGSRELLAIADVLEENVTICWCGKKAIMNARYEGDHILRSGDQVQMGGNESYLSLCRKHYRMGKISP